MLALLRFLLRLPAAFWNRLRLLLVFCLVPNLSIEDYARALTSKIEAADETAVKQAFDGRPTLWKLTLLLLRLNAAEIQRRIQASGLPAEAKEAIIAGLDKLLEHRSAL